MTLPVYRVDAPALAQARIEVDGDEGRHAVTVRRTRVGDRLVLTDGAGQGVECDVVEVGKRSFVATATAHLDEPAPAVELWVAQAIPKGEHADRAVDLLTEVGADRIVPWLAARNVVTWKGDRVVKGLARWRSTVAAAAKQSRRLRWPLVGEPATTDDLIRLMADVERTYVLHETADAAPLADPPSHGRVLVVVGPEGGISDDELAALTAAGAVPTRLGPTVLRSSTAGVVAAAALLSRARW